MLYQFLLNYVDIFGFLNVFKYLTFRTGLSFFTSLTIIFVKVGSYPARLELSMNCLTSRSFSGVGLYRRSAMTMRSLPARQIVSRRSV